MEMLLSFLRLFTVFGYLFCASANASMGLLLPTILVTLGAGILIILALEESLEEYLEKE